MKGVRRCFKSWAFAREGHVQTGLQPGAASFLTLTPRGGEETGLRPISQRHAPPKRQKSTQLCNPTAKKIQQVRNPLRDSLQSRIQVPNAVPKVFCCLERHLAGRRSSLGSPAGPPKTSFRWSSSLEALFLARLPLWKLEAPAAPQHSARTGTNIFVKRTN